MPLVFAYLYKFAVFRVFFVFFFLLFFFFQKAENNRLKQKPIDHNFVILFF